MVTHYEYTLCHNKKTCDHVFYDKLNENCPFTKTFAILIPKSVCHQQVFLFSHLTYLMQIIYLGKLSRPKYHEFSCKLSIFPMLQLGYQMQNCHFITQTQTFIEGT